MISEEAKGRYLDLDSVDAYNRERDAQRKKRMEAERAEAGRRMSCWAGLVLLGGGLAAMILQGLIDQRIGVVALAVICAVLGRGTK